MNISSIYFIVIDVIIVAIFALNFYFSYKNGLLYELVSLFLIIISLFLGYFLSPILAARLYLVTPSFNDSLYINLSAIYYGINVIVWFIVISIFFIILFMLIKPIFKFVTKVPIVGWLNKFAGIIFGLIKGFIICSLLSFILSTVFVNNSNDIKNGTLLKYVDFFSVEATNFISKNIDFKKIDENISDFDMQATRKVFEEWLIKKQGFINE